MSSPKEAKEKDNDLVIPNPKYVHGLPVSHPDFMEPCCNKERRVGGWCESCGDPPL